MCHLTLKRVYILCVSGTQEGLYSPVGITSARVMSACGRVVSVGFEAVGDEGFEGVVDEEELRERLEQEGPRACAEFHFPLPGVDEGEGSKGRAPTRPLNGTAVFVDGMGLPGRQRPAGEPRDRRVPPVPSVTAVFDGCWRTRCARRVTRRTRQTGGNGYPVDGSTRPVLALARGPDGRVKTRPSRPSTRQKRGRVGALSKGERDQ
ncbi:hypothetical protein B0H19DRAFT_1332245 [Mycena capillaripes]|nr:hypothetical protein B0H19DRAFT_1332245 [Mycena capillaripes]